MAELRSLRPERTQKLVCGIAEFEVLVQLGTRGWGVPAAIIAWQTKPETTPLEAHLGHLAGILRPHFDATSDLVERWLQRLPVQQGEAA